MKLILRSILIVIIFLLITAAGLLAGDYIFTQEKIPAHYYLENIPVGNLTAEEALTKLSSTEINSISNRTFSFSYGNKLYNFKLSDVKAVPQFRSSLISMIEEGKNTNYFHHVYMRVTKQKKIFPLLFSVNKQPIEKFLKKLKKKVDAKMANAKFYVTKEKKVLIANARPGRNLNVQRSANEAVKRINEGYTKSPLYVKVDYPKITTTMLKEIPKPAVLGTYTTYYGTHNSPNRIHNVILLSGFINDTLLKPGETFSMLSKTGKFTAQEGYLPALVIIKDELVPEYGGGACQVATTLYNAVQFADLKIRNRLNHNIYFSIYPLGRDATIYPPSPDFRFMNQYEYPVLIRTYATKGSLTIRVFGNYTGKQVSFSYPSVAYHAKKVKKVTWKTFTKKGSREGEVITRKIKNTEYTPRPFSVSVIRTVKQAGKVIKQETISSYYTANGDTDRVKIRNTPPR